METMGQWGDTSGVPNDTRKGTQERCLLPHLADEWHLEDEKSSSGNHREGNRGGGRGRVRQREGAKPRGKEPTGPDSSMRLASKDTEQVKSRPQEDRLRSSMLPEGKEGPVKGSNEGETQVRVVSKRPL